MQYLYYFDEQSAGLSGFEHGFFCVCANPLTWASTSRCINFILIQELALPLDFLGSCYKVGVKVGHQV